MKNQPGLVAAIYARYSSEKQSVYSTDDQIRMCRERAQQMGFSVTDELIFKDDALSGQEYTYEKRDGFHALDKAWTQHRFDVLIVEEFSRLSRDGVEHAKLIRRLENDRRVRLVTLDGIDTKDHDWQLRLGLQGVLAQSEVRKTRDRVKRGMVGQLERGYMIASPAYGYDFRRVFDDAGNRIGTHWTINEAESRVVQQVFEKRSHGMSYNQIAVWLNTSGIPCQRKGRDEHGGFWRPGSVKRMLSNSIYRGEFVWHGSSSYHYHVKKRGDAVETRAFARPQLRLVDDDVWHRCNKKSISRSGYGGGKNPYSGLVVCGYCEKPLSSSAINRRCQSMYCSSCTLAKGIDEQHERLSSTIAVTGVKTLLGEALKQFLTPAFIEAFRQSLQLRLTGDVSEQIKECKLQLERYRKAQERLSRMLVGVDSDDVLLEQRYDEARAKVRAAEMRLGELQEVGRVMDAEALKAQLAVDPAAELNDLLNAQVAPERLRSLLAQLFPVVVFEGKVRTHLSIFRVQFAPGSALSLASSTANVLDEYVERYMALQYHCRPTSKSQGSFWSVQMLQSNPLQRHRAPGAVS